MNEYTKEAMLKKLSGFSNQELYWLQIAWLELDFNDEKAFKNHEESLRCISQEYRSLYRYPDPTVGWEDKLSKIDATELYDFFNGFLKVKGQKEPNLLEEVINELNNSNQLMAIEQFNNRYDEITTGFFQEGNLYAEVNNTYLYE